MAKALYRKYRSKSLDEVVGQEHITKTLKHALSHGTVSHAYLFTGPHGVGKTSVARILAHAVNKLPYDNEANHIDIIEIDAASNRRIDEIRDLREKAHITPAIATYKVYIIDEVHMLTKEAFNALLKTLEEPPEHVIFILATTEAHKLPDTIISRTQRFTFKPIDTAKTLSHLRFIAEKERIKIDDGALELIAEHSGGSFRDSISLLDQASNLGKSITAKEIENLLGIAPPEAVNQLEAALLNGTPKELLDSLQQLKDQGFQAASIAKQLSARLRSLLLDGQATSPQPTAGLLAQLLGVPSAHDPESYLELTLLVPVLERYKSDSINHQTDNKKAAQPVKAQQPGLDEPSVKAKQVISAEQSWPTVLAALKERHNTLYSVVRMAEPVWEGKALTLKFAFPFHQKRLNEAKNQQLLLDIIEELTKQSVELKSIVDKKAKTPVAAKLDLKPTDDLPLNTISNIFGGGELLD